jgi:hypothetical protein
VKKKQLERMSFAALSDRLLSRSVVDDKSVFGVAASFSSLVLDQAVESGKKEKG